MSLSGSAVAVNCIAHTFLHVCMLSFCTFSNSLPPEGFGRYTQEDWKLWINQIANESCASSEQAEGEPAQGESCAREGLRKGNNLRRDPPRLGRGPTQFRFFDRKELGFSTGNASPEGAALYTRRVVYVVCARSFVASELLV